MYTGSLSKFEVLYHWTFGESEFKSRGGVFFSYLRDHKANIYFLQETYSERADENIRKKNWASELLFSHGTTHCKGVCILINPFVQPKVDYSSANDSANDPVVS